MQLQYLPVILDISQDQDVISQDMAVLQLETLVTIAQVAAVRGAVASGALGVISTVATKVIITEGDVLDERISYNIVNLIDSVISGKFFYLKIVYALDNFIPTVNQTIASVVQPIQVMKPLQELFVLQTTNVVAGESPVIITSQVKELFIFLLMHRTYKCLLLSSLLISLPSICSICHHMQWNFLFRTNTHLNLSNFKL